MKKKILSLLLVLLMLVSLIPGAVFAAEDCNCDLTEGVHAATCPNYVCPDCGTAGWHETCPETGDDTGSDEQPGASDETETPAEGETEESGGEDPTETAVCEVCGADPCTCEQAEAGCPYCDYTLAEDGTVIHSEICYAEYAYDGTADVGKYVQLIPEVAEYGVTVSKDPLTDEGIWFYYDEFGEGTVMKITGWYWDPDTSGLWYRVELYKGAFPESTEEYQWPVPAWILQDYTDYTYDYDAALEFVSITCDICGKEGCTAEHVQCAHCGQYDCTVQHTYCGGCGALDCTTEHIACPICHILDCGLEHEQPEQEEYIPLTAPVIPENPQLPEEYDVAIIDETGTPVTAGGIYLASGEQASLSAWSALGEEVSYQWQIFIDEGDGYWVDITGQTGKGLLFSRAMLTSALDATGCARLRCVTDNGSETMVSAAVPVAVGSGNSGEAAELETSMLTMRSLTISSGSSSGDGITDEDVVYHTVTIEYVYGSGSKFVGQRVSLPYIAEVVHGETLSRTVSSPNCVGYAPDQKSLNLGELLGAVNENQSLTVEYNPAVVSYTVRHYVQNVDDDDYTWVDTTMATGYTEALTSDAAAKTYVGFTAQPHYHEEIAADSSTMIDIYYDRNYYLMSFDLDGGHGVEAVYARYGADISVSDPEKSGYTFDGWALDGTDAVMPSTMPAENREYTAQWETIAGGAQYTIAYWLENPNTDGQYDFAGSASVRADAGTTVSGDDSAVDKGVFTADERQYYAYNADRTDTNVTVAGDGSTVVNVYYDRNEYTLKFYYARLDGTTYDIADNTNNSSANGGTAASASWVGNFATKPTLDSKYTEQEEVINGRTYYYFTLTAKYGQDLSTLWPNAPLSSAGDYNFISWGTHYDSGYYNNNNNKNIKGVYTVMDSGLLIDPSVTADQGVNHWMVGYWNTDPTMYIYEIYYSLLIGETADRTYDGINYKKVVQYTVGSTDVPSGQTALSFEGVTIAGKDYDSNNKVDGAVIRFYYNRTVNNVTLDDGYGTTYSYEIPYGATVSSYITTVPTPTYPTALPANAYEFGGWYQSKEGIGALDTSITMPNEDLIYYAKWTPKVYDVKIYQGNASNSDIGTLLSTQKVNYGEKATKPTDPTMDDAAFIGWYYKVTEKNEQRFDFDNMVITQNMTVYAKWRSSVMKQVEIDYVVEDENGVQTQIAETETLMMRLGQTRTFEAKTGNSLYTDYQSNYFPTTASHSITITDADIESDDPVTFTFRYKHYGRVPYRVKFTVVELNGTTRPAFRKDENGNPVFVDTSWDSDAYTEYFEEHWTNDKAVVVELFEPDTLADQGWALPDAYLPNALKIQKIIVPSETNPLDNIEANTIEFIYTHTEPVVDPDNPDPDPDDPEVYQARYLVQHYIESSSVPGEYSLYRYSDKTGLSGETVTASPISVPGYTYSYLVTEGKKQSGTSLAPGTDGEINTEDDVLSGTITADDSLELNFYYEVNPYPYQVLYLEDVTNRELHEAKTTDSNGDPLTGLFGSEKTETAIDIEGYDLVGAATKTIKIQMEAGDTASVNTIVFYYKLKSAQLVISKKVELDPTQAAQEGISEIPDWVYDQEFVFTIFKEDGFPNSVYHYTFKDVNGNKEERVVNAGIQTIVITLKHGESAQFDEFPMGTYTVTETYVPGFKATVDNYIAQAHDRTLDVDGETEKLEFFNRFPFYTGDLVVMKTVTKQDETNDPPATEPYKVTVVLTPDDSAREIDRVITWTDADGTARTFTVPKLSSSTATEFTFEILVPVNGEVKMVGVPVGSFTVTEEAKGTIGYIYDFYKVKYNKAVHENDEVTGTNHIVSGVIHGGHPTAVTFNNTYKKGDLTINKTVTLEYDKDTWTEDTFTFTVTGTTELPNGTYKIKVDGVEADVTVADRKLELTGSITITRTDGATSWSGSLTFENLPAGYYTVTETAGLGNDKYSATILCDPDTGLVNDTETSAKFNFTNTFKQQAADFTIKRTNAQPGQVFVYRVAGSDLSIDVTVVADKNGNGSVTIADLPFGEYTVTQLNDWSWRYTDAAQTVEHTDIGTTVTFDDSTVKTQWLSGNSSLWRNEYNVAAPAVYNGLQTLYVKKSDDDEDEEGTE